MDGEINRQRYAEGGEGNLSVEAWHVGAWCLGSKLCINCWLKGHKETFDKKKQKDNGFKMLLLFDIVSTMPKK